MFPFRLFWRFFVFDNFAYHTQHNAGTFFSTGFRLAVHRETKMNKRNSKKTHCVVMSNYQHHMEWVSENQSRVTDSKSCCTLYLFIFALVSKRSWRRNNVNYYSTLQLKHITYYMNHLEETGQMYNLILQVRDGHRGSCSILFIHFSEAFADAHMCSSQTKQDILLTNTSPLTQLKVIGWKSRVNRLVCCWLFMCLTTDYMENLLP